jgi:hypothetical protein
LIEIRDFAEYDGARGAFERRLLDPLASLFLIAGNNFTTGLGETSERLGDAVLCMGRCAQETQDAGEP